MEEKPRSLSIQSLISSPGLEPPVYSEGQNRKRKGSDEDDGRGTRNGSVVPTSVSIEDPDVREVVEALGGLKGGEFFYYIFLLFFCFGEGGFFYSFIAFAW